MLHAQNVKGRTNKLLSRSLAIETLIKNIMITENKETFDKKKGIIIALAIVDPFFDIPETNGRDESEEEDLNGSEPIDDPLERDDLEVNEVKDSDPVKESDLEDLDPIDPAEEGIDDDDYEDLDEDDDYIDLDEEETSIDDLDPSADELGRKADYIDSIEHEIGQGTDLRDGTTII